jgi:hypothetical protein
MTPEHSWFNTLSLQLPCQLYMTYDHSDFMHPFLVWGYQLLEFNIKVSHLPRETRLCVAIVADHASAAVS